MSYRQGALRHIIVLVLYMALALLLTWPLASKLATHVPGDGIDDPALAWNLWWIQERLVSQLNFDIFVVDWMFFPIQVNLAFYTLTPLNGLLSVPLQSGLSLILASNLLLLTSFVLGGYGAFLLTRFLLCRRRTDLGGPPSVPARLFSTDDWIALAAGLIYAFASSKLFYASLGQFNIASSQWIPFCVLYVVRIYPAAWGGGRRSAVMAGLFLICQAWSELTYASFLLIFIGLYFVYVLIQWSQDRHTVMGPSVQADGEQIAPGFWAIMGHFALLGIVAFFGILPFLWAMAPDLLREGDFFGSGGGFSDVFSADLLGYLMPTQLHPWVGDWVAGRSFPNDKGQQITVGYLAVLLLLVGIYGLVRSRSRCLRREGWFWLATTALFWWLTLGSQVRWAGESTGIPGPFALVSQLPFFSGNRYPSRYSVMLMLCVAVLVSYGLAWLLDRLKSSVAAGNFSLRVAAPVVVLAVGIVFLLEHLSIPLPNNDFRAPPIYAQLAALPDDTTVLELPTGWRNGARVLGRSDVLIMMQQWYQTVHGKRRLGGNTSRNPAYKFQYFTEAPLVGDLIALMNADREHVGQAVALEWDDMVARNLPIASSVLHFLNVGYITVHVDHTPVELLNFIDEVLPVTLIDEWQGPDWQGRPSTIRLYTVQRDEESSWDVDLASDMGKLHLAEGWSALPSKGTRFALRPRVDLMLDLPIDGGDLSLLLYDAAQPPDLSVNGIALEEVTADGQGWITATVPAGTGDQPVDRLTLHFYGPAVPVSQTLASPGDLGWPIGDTGANLAGDAAIVVRSAGEEAGNFAQIYVNGIDVARNGRGYNLVALNSDGSLLESVVYDTFASADEAHAMATWLLRWPAGTVIAGAVRDEASMQLTEDAVDALSDIGVAADLRGRFRWGHAFIGVAGAERGSGLEESVLLQPANVSVGAPVDGEFVFGGVKAIRLYPSAK